MAKAGERPNTRQAAAKDGGLKALWTPQPGPQSDAISADWCPILFYGGGKFSGKSDFLLGDYLQDLETYREHWQGIIFRRALTEFTELKLRANELFPKIGGKWQEQKSQWVFPDFGTADQVPTLRFRYLERLQDIRLYEGHCVACGTLIRMADGRDKPIETIKRGELVQTLSGPRKVLYSHPPTMKQCVRASIAGGEQIHPIDHKILTSAGWVSYASSRGIDSKAFEGSGQSFERLPSVDIESRCLALSPHQDRAKADTPKQFDVYGSSCLSFAESSASASQSFGLRRSDQRQPYGRRLQSQNYRFWPHAFGDAWRALIDYLEALSFQFGYRFCYDFCGALSQSPPGSARDVPPLQVDAEEPYPDDYRRDGAGSTQEHIRQDLRLYEYPHPYSGRVLQATEESIFVPCKLTPVGEREVYDLTVEGVNHYISSCGIINKNSYPWLGVDELGDWEDESAFFRLITLNRYGRAPIPTKRIRATGNPGGRGHLWIKKYFVDPAPLGSKLLFDEVLEKNYMFILGTYRDNKIGMQNDPDYDKNLNRSGSAELVRALKEGDFSVVAGAFFTEFGIKHIAKPFPIPRHWTRFMSMDWGACGDGDPFSIGWWAIADGNDMDGTIPYYRPGTMIRYREWFGKEFKEKVSVQDVVEGIHRRESGDPEIAYRVAGGDIRKKLDKSGPSIFELFEVGGIYFQRADMNRAPGWLVLRERLKGKEGIPDLFVFDTCIHSIERIPTIQHNLKDANDIEESNDDIADEWRYGVMARPYVSRLPPAERPFEEQFRAPTIDELWALKEQMKSFR